MSDDVDGPAKAPPGYRYVKTAARYGGYRLERIPGSTQKQEFDKDKYYSEVEKMNAVKHGNDFLFNPLRAVQDTVLGFADAQSTYHPPSVNPLDPDYDIADDEEKYGFNSVVAPHSIDPFNVAKNIFVAGAKPVAQLVTTVFTAPWKAKDWVPGAAEKVAKAEGDLFDAAREKLDPGYKTRGAYANYSDLEKDLKNGDLNARDIKARYIKRAMEGPTPMTQAEAEAEYKFARAKVKEQSLPATFSTNSDVEKAKKESAETEANLNRIRVTEGSNGKAAQVAADRVQSLIKGNVGNALATQNGETSSIPLGLGEDKISGIKADFSKWKGDGIPVLQRPAIAATKPLFEEPSSSRKRAYNADDEEQSVHPAVQYVNAARQTARAEAQTLTPSRAQREATSRFLVPAAQDKRKLQPMLIP